MSKLYIYRAVIAACHSLTSLYGPTFTGHSETVRAVTLVTGP